MSLPIDHNRLLRFIKKPDEISLSFDDAVAILLLASLHQQHWSTSALSAAGRVYNQLKSQLSKNPVEAREAATAVLHEMDLELLVHNGRVHGLFAELDDISQPPTLYEAEIPGTGTQWRVTSEHERSLRIVAAERDESLCIEGFSGTGKTTFTSLLSNILNPRTTLLLAQTPLQLEALKRRVPGFSGITFAELSRRLYVQANNLPQGNLGTRFRAGYSLSHTQIATLMGYQSVGSLSPVQVAQAATSIVRQFCYRRHETFSDSLLPRSLRTTLSPMEASVLVGLAEKLWGATLGDPTPSNALPVRGYHIMKWLNLHRIPVPKRMASHILIDEAHDIPPTMLSILDASPAAVISLGDRFQYFGENFAPRRANHIRARQFRQSVRTDRQVGNLLNDVLIHHPQAPTTEFVGNPQTKLNELRYERLDQDTLEDFVGRKGTRIILTGYIWTVATTIQRLAAADIPFFYTGHAGDLQLLIADAERLFKDSSEFITHPMLINHRSWDNLRRQAGSAILALENLFARGFTSTHFNQSMTKAVATVSDHHERAVGVGLVEHAKNREYDHVLITSDVRYGHYGDVVNRGTMISTLYTGLTRARRTISYQRDMIEKMMAGLSAPTSKLKATPTKK